MRVCGAASVIMDLGTLKPKSPVPNLASETVRVSPPSLSATTVTFWYSGSTVIHTPLFGSGMGPIQLDDVRCQGNEKALLNCAHREMRQHNCYRSNEVAVACRAGEHKSTSVVFIS